MQKKTGLSRSFFVSPSGPCPGSFSGAVSGVFFGPRQGSSPGPVREAGEAIFPIRNPSRPQVSAGRGPLRMRHGQRQADAAGRTGRCSRTGQADALRRAVQRKADNTLRHGAIPSKARMSTFYTQQKSTSEEVLFCCVFRSLITRRRQYGCWSSACRIQRCRQRRRPRCGKRRCRSSSRDSS